MSSPYFPPPPHSTPQHYALTRPRAPRQPVVNPYEKFTQADFDHWIGGITGALRRALGHEPDEPESVTTVFEHGNRHQETSDDDGYASEGEGVNDSLADIRARYVTRLNKGKGRDPMEGPGLSTWGKGNKDMPIEIDLGEDGSPDEDALDDEEVLQHLSFVHDSDEEEQEDAEEQLPEQWQLPQSSLRTRTDDVSDQEAGEEDDESASSDGDERLGSDDVIEVLSSDEEPGEAQKIASEDEHGSSEDEDLGGSAEEDEGSERDGEEDVDAYSPVSGSACPHGVVVADDDEELEENRSVDEEEDLEEGDEYEGEGSDEVEEEYDELRPSKRDGNQSPEGGIITLDSGEEEDQLDDEADVIQPPDHDTAFPPHSSDTQTHIEIRDPWLGPQTYAEDFYSGGPVLPLPGAALTAHHLGANDDAGFLTPDVVTPAESNERESLADEEQDDLFSHQPHLEFVHGRGAQAPEVASVEAEVVGAYDVTIMSKKEDHISCSSPPPVGEDAESTDVTPAGAEEIVNRDDVQQRDLPTITEDDTKISQPLQNDVQNAQEEACQAEDDLDRAYEEMDAEVERESHAEDSLRQCEQRDEPSRQPPVTLGSLTVTLEEVPDEDASDKEEEEQRLSSSPAVVPLGTSDLDVDIESILSDEQGEGCPEDLFSLHMLEAEGQEIVVHAEDEPTTGTEEQVVPEVTENEEVELEQPLDVVEHEALGLPVSEPSADDPSLLVDLEEFPNDTTAQTSVFPPVDFVHTAVELELELEQQQLPTPPAEQEEFLHRSPIRQPSPEPEDLFDTTATEYDYLPTAEDEVDTEQTTATSSALDQEVSEAQAKPLFEEAADGIDSMEDIAHQASLFEEAVDEIDSTEDIAHQASLFEEAVDKVDFTEDVSHQASLFGEAADEIDSTEDIMPQASLEHETTIAGFDEEFVDPTSILNAVDNDIDVQDVTDNLDAIPDDWPGIIDEVASKAPSEEFLPLDEQESTSVYSKEGSIVSLPVTDGSHASGAMSYDVEVFMDEVTDDDADGEFDPDTSLNLTQDSSSSRELKDLAGEIFKDDWWTSDTCRKSPSEGDRTAHTVVKHDEDLGQDERATAQGLDEETEPAVTFTGHGGDEEDIASSREASPSPQATRSPSLTVDPKELMTGSPESVAPAMPEDSPESEKELYGGAEANNQVQTRENTVESETLLAIETMTTGPEVASPTIPGLMLAASKRPPSPIPGLGTHLSGETVIEAADSEIPGLTWSKMVSSSAHVSYGSSSISGGPLRSPSFPQLVPSTLSTSSDAFLAPRRATTEQGLFPDPYPYSLSTPGLDSVKDDGEDTDEDLEEQDMSMSSSSTTSTAEKDIVESLPENDKEGNNASEKPPAHEAPETHEATDSDQVDLDLTQDTVQLAGSDDVFTSGDADQDRDADGDLDPDFLQFPDNVADENVAPTKLTLVFMESAVTPQVIEVSPNVDIKDFVESPDLPDEAINEQRPEADGLSPDANAQTEFVTEADVEGSDLAGMPETEEIPKAQNTDSRHSTPQPSIPDEPDVTTPTQMSLTMVDKTSLDTLVLSQNTKTSLPEKSTQNGKRKRSPSPQPQHTTERIDRQEENGESIWASDDASRRRSLSPNGAKRARIDHVMNGKRHISYLTDQSSLSSDEDDNSDANSTGHMLRTASASPKSPAPPAPAATVEPFYPMLHRHGSGAKKQLYQERVFSQRPTQKAQLGSSMTRPSLPASTSRTTRSNCRYRKISVPKEDDGPRVCFLVPGCSLGDEEVIEENEIEDLGEASYADSLRMIGDIESLDFDSYLIGVLRQLVGVDLLREQEVFYLPAPGEEPIRKPQLKKTGSDKSASGKKSSKSGNLDTSSILGTPRPSITSVKAPSSKAGSVSTTASRPTRERGSSTPPSSLHSDLSSIEGEEIETPEWKARKAARSKLEKGMTLATVAERSGRGGKQVKRSRRLASDALAFKPASGSEGESSDDNTSQSRHRSMRTTSRGSVKRTHSGRTFASPEGGGGRDAKRHKRDR